MSRGTCEVTGSSQEESQRELFARGASTEFQPLALANLPGTNSLPLARGPGPRQWSPWGPGPVRTMANVVVKTIWQSKEINEAGDPPSGAETRAQSTRDLLGKASPKAFPRKKKAVSFHGVEPPPASEAPPGRLNLKRSSACTNVSLLNLTGDDSESMDDGSGQGASPLSPPLPSRDPAWSEDDTDPSTPLVRSPPGDAAWGYRPPTPLDMVNSGLVRTKDSVTSLKERASRVNRRVQSLQESCRKVSRSVEDAEIKTNVLKKSSVLLEAGGHAADDRAAGGAVATGAPGAAGVVGRSLQHGKLHGPGPEPAPRRPRGAAAGQAAAGGRGPSAGEPQGPGAARPAPHQLCQPGLHQCPEPGADGGVRGDAPAGGTEAVRAPGPLPRLPASAEQDPGTGAGRLGDTRTSRDPELQPAPGPGRSPESQDLRGAGPAQPPGEAPRPGPPPRPAQLPAGPAVPGWGAPDSGATSTPAALTPTTATNKVPALALGLHLRPCVRMWVFGQGGINPGLCCRVGMLL
ncbi:testis-specific serine kinase substrate isoform X5 [Dermochelys coriacea]|uniref:testis-specific serine kinase substrate isoform X5 n=1 Tax=Dermochelys coriacea TaxID=27794 RepID=UPI0018E76912|nr:testis-specific serine kinase substrate isoform X5 [Dermochelys coriacea]